MARTKAVAEPVAAFGFTPRLFDLDPNVSTSAAKIGR